MSAPRENQNPLDWLALEQFGEQGWLCRFIGENDTLGDPLDRGRLRRHRDAGRIGQHRIGKPGDFLRHGGGKEQRLPFFAQHRNDALDVVNEAHVEHAVGFVENQDFDLVERHGALIDEVEQAAGRCHQDFDAVR